ncbi:dCTP deaminase domain-containing protein [Porphyromonas gulae]|uniref:dCTP deaminase domain-containing protein n=1 Tax=Porphyromonas gulae TaxID=111105 RepID=UPI00126A3DBA|nr:hypothetical protein [Porphyromonas gulae]
MKRRSKNNCSGVLTCDQIKSLGIISENFNEKNLRPASYDLSLGDDYFVPPETRSEGAVMEKCSQHNDVLKIGEFSTVGFSTDEVLKMPSNVIGRFDLRIHLAIQGLVLQVGTQIEPGYEGRLFGLLINFSSEQICIHKGSRILTAEFSYTSSDIRGLNTKICRTLSDFCKIGDGLSPRPIVQGSIESVLKFIKKSRKQIEDDAKSLKMLMGEYELKNKKEKSQFYALSIAALSLALTVIIPISVAYIDVRKDYFDIKSEVNQLIENNKVTNNMIKMIQDQRINKKENHNDKNITDSTFHFILKNKD